MKLYSQSMASYTYSTVTNGSLVNMSGSTDIFVTGTYRDDDPSSLQNIGFNFVFMGTSYSQFSINSNGQMRLGSTIIAGGAQLPGAGLPLIAPVSGDNAIRATGKAHFKVTGSSPNRVLVVEWTDVRIPFGSSVETGTYSNFQVLLYESTGKIEFIYGRMYNMGTSAQTRGIFFSTGVSAGQIGQLTTIAGTPTYNSNSTSMTTTSFTASSNMTNLNSAADGSRRVFTFTPPASPSAPSGLSFASVGLTGMTLNWTDNSSDETGFLVYYSIDNVTFNYLATTAANTATYTATGLTTGAPYYWQVYAVNEGAMSSAATGSQATISSPTLTGTKYIGTGANPQDYANLTAAFNDITLKGLAGSVVLELQSGYSSAGETFPLTFSNFIGLGATNTLKIYPSSGVTGLSISSANTTATIDINNGDYVTIDGRPGGTGSAKELTISNTSTSGTAIRFINDATYNTLKYLKILGVNTSTSSGVIVFSTTTGTTGNDNNTIDNCDLRDGATTPANIIYSSGSTSTSILNNSSNTISNNNIFNFFLSAGTSTGVLISSGNTDWTLSGNSFYQTASRAGGSTQTAINISNSSGNNFTLTGNYIGGDGPGATVTTSKWSFTGAVANIFNGIVLSVGTSTASSVQGNTIANISVQSSSTSNFFNGMTISAGSVNVGNISSNTIGNTSISATTATASSIAILQSTSNGGSGYGIYNTSSGTLNISNNRIGGVFLAAFSGANTLGSSFYGIRTTAGTNTISTNTVGSTTNANSIYSEGSKNTTTNANTLVGILVSSSGSNSISGNNVRNISYAATGTGPSSGVTVLGISASAGTNSISSNVITDLNNNSPNTGSGTTASVIGIILTSSSGTSATVSGNTVSTLVNNASAAVVVTGIYYSGPSSGTNVVEKNIIQGFVTGSNTAVQNGMSIVLGTANFQNNIIRLGIDKDGTSVTSSTQINGIYKTGGICNFYFNTVYIGGTGVTGTTIKTYAFNLSSHSTEDIRNNIFVNVRTNSTPTLLHYAVWYNSGSLTSNFISDYNIYQVSSSGGILSRVSSTDRPTIQSLREALPGYELNTGVGDPKLSGPTGTFSTTGFKLTDNSPAEGTGLAGIATAPTDDFEGEARSGLTPVDMGADAGNYAAPTAAQDIFSPVIVFTTLSNVASTSNRTLTAEITDKGTGINNTSGTKPRIYFKKSNDANSFVGNTSTDNGWKWTEGTNTSGSTWNFTIDNSIINGGSVAAGTVVWYYVVGQDLATTPNVTFNYHAGASGASVATTGMTAPTTPNSYNILVGFSGTISVGTGQTYTSLTGASNSLFAAINAGSLTGNVTVNIVSDITETGNNVLNQWTEDGVGSYTLTIQTDGNARVLSGGTSSSTTPLIDINGADRVTIDGGASKLLTLRNANATAGNTGPVVRFANGCASCTITNSIIESNATTNLSGVITIGSGTNSVSISNNDIRDSRGTNAGSPNTGIYSNTNTNTLNISGNKIYNWKGSGTSYGLYLLSVADAAQITGNSFYMESGITTAANAQTAIYVAAGNNHLISGNYIGGQSATGGSASAHWGNTGAVTVTGISLAVGTATASTVTSNYIGNFRLSSTASSIFYGINISSGKVDIGTTVGTGNTVGNLVDSTKGIILDGTGTYYGIYGASSNVVNIRYNTVANIYSSSTGTPALRGIYHSSGSFVTISLTNNTVKELVSASTNTGTGSSSVIIGMGYISSNCTLIMDQNTISGLRAITTSSTLSPRVLGIYVAGPGTSGGLVRRNRIYDLTNTSTQTSGGPYLTGMLIFTGSSYTIANNQISITNGANTNGVNIYGIWENYTGTSIYYYNTIYIGGSVSATAFNTACFYRNTGSTVTFRNNLFYNERSGGTGKHYAVSNANGTPATGWSATASNNNVFITASASDVGEWGVGTAKTFDTWKTSTSPNQDAYSYADLSSSIPAANLFVSVATGNLNLKTTNAEAWIAAGKGVQITGAGTTDLDYDGNTRSTTVNGGPTCIGSHEILASGLPATPSATVTGSIAVTAAQNIIVYGKTVGTITWNSGTSLPSAIHVRYVTGKQHPDITSGNGSYAYWSITPTGGTDYNYSITLNYDPACLGLVNEALLKLAKWDGSGWVYFDGATSNTTNKTVSVSGLSSFSDFVLTSSDNPLPVELVNFSGKAKSRNVNLTWETKTETDNSGFEVERKDKNGDWKKIGFVEGFGSSNSPKYYTFEDKKLSSGKHNYRLKQIDNDGTTSYSDEVEVTIDLPTEFALSQNYPNPFNPSTKVDYQLAMDAKVTIELYSITGEKVATLLSQELEAGYYSMMIDSYTHGMASGIYIYRMIATDALGKSFVSTKKLSLIK